MPNKIEKYENRMSAISAAAGEVKRVCVDSQFDGNQLINDPQALVNQIGEAAAASPFFEALGTPDAATQVATSWGSAIREYERVYGEMPRDEQLASCAESLCAMVGAGGESTKMFESTGINTNTSEGIILRARTAALILPVQLAAATSDAATYVQGGKDLAEVFRLNRVAASTLGTVQKGDKLEEGFNGQYVSMKQVYQVPAAAVTVDTGNITAVAFNTSGFEGCHNPAETPVLNGSVRVLLNGRVIASDIEGSGLLGNFYVGANRHVLSPSETYDLATGKIHFGFTPALPSDGVQLAVQFDVDVERKPVMPEVSFTMDSFKLRPHQLVIAAGHSVQAYWKMNREYGLDMRSMQTNSARNLIAYSQDMQRMNDMIVASHANPVATIPLIVPQGAYFKEKYEEMHEHLLILSQVMLESTKVSGLVGMYAGTKAAAAMKALGAPFFTPVEGYRQVPRIHYCGLLFGKWKVFEVPTEITVGGYKLAADEALCYARGSDVGQAGLVVGDAIPATLYRHGTDANLFSRDTVFAMSYGDISPMEGANFFRKVKFALKA